MEVPSSSSNNNIDKGKWKKGIRERMKKKQIVLLVLLLLLSVVVMELAVAVEQILMQQKFKLILRQHEVQAMVVKEQRMNSFIQYSYTTTACTSCWLNNNLNFYHINMFSSTTIIYISTANNKKKWMRKTIFFFFLSSMSSLFPFSIINILIITTWWFFYILDFWRTFCLLSVP